MASRFRFLRASEILSQLTDYTLAHTDKLNDFTEGSALETLYESFSTLLEQYYYLNLENIKSSIMDSIYTTFGFYRKPQLKAYGQVMLVFSDTLSSDLTVSAGTQFSSSNSYYTQTYETLDETTIPAGVDTYSVTVYCTQGGIVGNIPAGVIDTASNLGIVSQVVNTEPFSTGQEAEPLSDTRRRFRQFIQAIQKGSIQAIQYGASNVPNVDSVYLDETPGYVRVYADDANGDLSNDLRIQIQNELYYWRSAGVPVEVLPVHKTTADMDIVLDVPTQSLRTTDLESQIGLLANNYLNSLSIGQEVNVNEIISIIMNGSSSINDVQANLKINPDAALRGSLPVSDANSIIINEHLYPKSIYQPTDRSVEEHYLISDTDDWDSQDWEESTTTTTSTTLDPNEVPDDEFERDALSNRIKMFVIRELAAGNINLTGLTWQDISGNKPNPSDSEFEDNPVNLQDAVKQVILEGVSKGKLNLGGTSWDDIDDIVNFSLEDDSGNNNSGIIPGPDSYETNPIVLGTSGLSNTFDYKFKDGATVGLLTNTNYNSMASVRFKFYDGSRLEILQTTPTDNMPYNYYDSGSTTPKSGLLPFEGTDGNNNNTLNHLTIQFSQTGITVTDNTTHATATIDYSKMTISYTYASGLVTLITINSGNPSDMYNSDVEIGSNLHFVYNFTDTGALNMFYTKFTVSSTGNVINSYYDGQGNTIRIDTYDARGNLIYSVDGSGNNLLPTTTNNPATTLTTTTTTVAPDTTTTTSTTTVYPFNVIQPVSAGDTPDDGYLPVFGSYTTASNEVVKAGTISVTFKQQ